MEPLRLRMASIPSRLGEISTNSSRIVRLIEDARSDGVDIICFPELSVTGYGMPSSRDHPLSEDDPAIGRIVDASSGIAVCFGYVDLEGHITQAVAEDGRIVGGYSKTHLGEREVGVMTPGDVFPVIKTRKANLGIQICWESHFPEISGIYALNGADVILMPFASGLGGARRQSSWDRFLPARAYDNTVFVASCNAFGDNGVGTSFGGGASIYDVRGEPIVKGEGECIVTADLDPAQMDRIRADGYESMRDVYFLDKRRPELYDRLKKGI